MLSMKLDRNCTEKKKKKKNEPKDETEIRFALKLLVEIASDTLQTSPMDRIGRLE